MKKLNFFAFAVVALTLFSSCDKNEMDITLTEVQDGNVKITVKNSSGDPIVDQKVEISNYNAPLVDLKTNSAGVVEFQNMLMGNYSIIIKDVADGTIEYNVYQPIQIITNKTKEYTITPSDYSGSATIHIVDDLNEPFSGLNIALFKSEDMYSGNFADIMEIAIKEGTTDDLGDITFEKLPFNDYGIILYIDGETDAQVESYAFSISNKDQKVKLYRQYYSW
jgi:hypothetical protein